MNFFQTFRGRLLLVLALLLITTLGVQYSLNWKTELENEKLRDRQVQSLVAGISLGFKAIPSDKRLPEIVKTEDPHFFSEKTIQRIQDIIIINEQWEIYDTLSEKYLPTQNEKKETLYVKLKDVKDLPPLVNASRLSDEDRENFPNADTTADVGDDEAQVIPVVTTNGRWYVMVILKTDKAESAWRAAQRSAPARTAPRR